MLDAGYAEQALKAKGMRITPQRRAILAYLDGNEQHPRIDEIAQHVQHEMPGVALSTIYNNVHDLVDLGLITELSEKDGIHLDPEMEPHAHLHCSSCGKIVDVSLDQTIESDIVKAAKLSGMKPRKVSVDMEGLCPSCA